MLQLDEYSAMLAHKRSVMEEIHPKNSSINNLYHEVIMTTPATKTLLFSVLIEKKEGAFVGHCLETGLVASALDESDVLSKMGKLLVRQVTFAIENNRLRDVYHSAPQEIWDKWIKTEERIINQSRSAIPGKVESGGFRPRFMIEQTSYASTC